MNSLSFQRRPIGNTACSISPVAMGCWPIAGQTGSKVNQADAIATLHQACFALGINHLDTGFGYGLDGESEGVVGTAVFGYRDEMMIATKGGIRTEADGSKRLDARRWRLYRGLVLQRALRQGTG